MRTLAPKLIIQACELAFDGFCRSRAEIPLSDADLAKHIDQDVPTRYQETQLRADVREAVHHLPHRVRSIEVLYYL